MTEHIDPVVIINPDEQRPKGALRERLGVASERRLVAVAHAGIAGEARSLTPLTRAGETLVELDLHATDALFPIAAWLGDCDAIHSAAGYNTFWEAHWLGYAERTTFVPISRRNDDPVARMKARATRHESERRRHDRPHAHRTRVHSCVTVVLPRVTVSTRLSSSPKMKVAVPFVSR